jgi:IS1 family transposase
MYTLSTEKKLAVISALVEGNSIRSISRMTNVDRNTIASLLLRTGERCTNLLDGRIRNLRCGFVQCDEIWTFVGKKQRRIRKDDSPEFGDQWVFVAMDAETKLVATYRIGKRSWETTSNFMDDLYKRMADQHRTQVTTDGFHFYRAAVPNAFGLDVDFAQLVKLYGQYGQHGDERYSPSPIVETISKVRNGDPDPERICTSHVERQNLTIRMAMRRFTRLTNAFSKKLSHLKAACALHFAHYNFCRVHSSLRVTPAMAAGIASEIWPLQTLLA